MIQPEAYYAAHKRCRTPEELGRLGFLVVGRGKELSPPPSPLELSFAETLMECNQWHTEKRDEIRSKAAERKRKQRTQRNSRGENATEQDAESDDDNVTKVTDVTNVTVTSVTDECHSDNCDACDNRMSQDLSIYLPNYLSITPTKVGVCNTRAPAQGSDIPESGVLPMQTPRVGIPTEKTVLAAVTVMGVTEAYARWWYKEMVARDWTNTNGSRITNQNWRPTLKAWFNRAKPEELIDINKAEAQRRAEKRTYSAEDWELCAERCARFRDGRCTAGATVPPNCQKPPMPPEECKGFLVG